MVFKLPIRGEPSQTLTAQVAGHIKQHIATRQLAVGMRLPSIRGLAQAMAVSRSTVIEAYDRLAAEGLIRARQGSGFYVCPMPQPLSLADIGPRLDREVDPFWVAHQALAGGDGLLKPGCGWLPPDWLAQDSLRRALRAIARCDAAELADYASPLGLGSLRQWIARRLADFSLGASPDQILLTDSGTQALDLVCRFLIEAGDTVLVDDPCYYNFHALLRAHRAKVVSVPYTPNGPDIASFERVLREHAPRLYLTNSVLHNPTGASLAPAVAHQVLRLAEQHALTIVEDDVFADFERDHATRLAAFDGLKQVVHISSFSKMLSASVRCGYIAARPDWIAALSDLKIATTFGGSRISASLVYRMLNDGSYRRHCETLRNRLVRAMGPVAANLRRLGMKPWIMPRAGMFLWCELPQGMDATEIARAALARDIVLAPGNVFSMSGSAGNFLRFNVAQSQDKRLYSVLADLLVKPGRTETQQASVAE